METIKIVDNNPNMIFTLLIIFVGVALFVVIASIIADLSRKKKLEKLLTLAREQRDKVENQ